uniref:C2H2-type domain-containing protein n=1 Tax=Panagrellus redivivus TaxID=6233 RepID=A0A7E4VRK9_PANRE
MLFDQFPEALFSICCCASAMAPPRSRQSSRRSSGGQRYEGRVTKTVSPSSIKAAVAPTVANDDPFNLSELNAALPTNALPSRLIRCQFCDMVFAKTYYTTKHQFVHAQEVSGDLKAAIVGKLAAEKPETQCIVCQRIFDTVASLREHRFQTEH